MDHFPLKIYQLSTLNIMLVSRTRQVKKTPDGIIFSARGNSKKILNPPETSTQEPLK